MENEKKLVFDFTFKKIDWELTEENIEKYREEIINVSTTLEFEDYEDRLEKELIAELVSTYNNPKPSVPMSDDQIMDENVICKLMDEVIYVIFLISKVNYSYSLKKNGYLSKDKEDESNRKKAIVELKDMIDGKNLKKNELVRKKSMNISMFGRKISLF